MINYPFKKKPTLTYNNTANRGMGLEEIINETNTYYLDHEIAVIYKKPIPIQITKVDYPDRDHAKIIEAFYKIPSTTDYNGIYNGKYIDFEAKETHNKTSFPLKNIHAHQIDHLVRCKKHGGISFVIIALVQSNEYYLIDIDCIYEYYVAKELSRKSIPLDVIREKGHLIKESYPIRLDYLSVVKEIYFKN